MMDDVIVEDHQDEQNGLIYEYMNICIDIVALKN